MKYAGNDTLKTRKTLDVGGKTYTYGVQEKSVSGVGSQAKVLNVHAAGTKAVDLWSLIYRGTGFVGTVTVVGPNASEAAVKEHGLEPLALQLLEQKPMDVEGTAAGFINEKVASADDALQGARDIIAEQINEDATVRGKMRKLFEQKATLQSKVCNADLRICFLIKFVVYKDIFCRHIKLRFTCF